MEASSVQYSEASKLILFKKPLKRYSCCQLECDLLCSSTECVCDSKSGH